MAKPVKIQAPTIQGSDGNVNTVLGVCTAQGCKSKESRFSFCSEHYEQFKFGLIKKDGAPCADYDKKFDQYQAYKTTLLKKVA